MTTEIGDQSGGGGGVGGGGAVLGWKLFGKVPPKHTPEKQPSEILQDYKARLHLTPAGSQGGGGGAEIKVRPDSDVPSTTALILQRRQR